MLLNIFVQNKMKENWTEKISIIKFGQNQRENIYSFLAKKEKTEVAGIFLKDRKYH